jgi:type I restriction enzyme, S subunit
VTQTLEVREGRAARWKAAARVQEIVGDGFDVKKFVENFDALADAAGAIERLRHFILDLAIRGRLTQRESSDEPAELLLKRLGAERVAARGSKSKAATPDVEPFEIPSTWAWARLDHLWLSVTDGDHQPPPKSREGVAFLTIGNVSSGKIDFTSTRFVPQDYFAGLDELRVPVAGDLLYTVVGSFGIPIMVNVDRQFCVQRHVAILKPLPSTNVRFIELLMASRFVFRQAEEGATGIAQPTVGLGVLRNFVVPVAPLAEQKRIVAKVDQLMALCDELEERQTKKREVGTRLTKSALEALTTAEGPEEFDAAWKRVVENFGAIVDRAEKVGELRRAISEAAVRGRLTPGKPLFSESTSAPGTNSFALPAGWGWVKMGESFDVSGGIQKTPARTPKANHHPYLRVENVQRGRLDLDRIERFELAPGELDRWHLEKGDLLIVEGNGSEREIGRCAIWMGEIQDCVHQNHIIRCRAEGALSPAFTMLFLNSPSGMAEMKSLAITTSGLFSLSVGKIRGIDVPVPPAHEQDRILGVVERLMKLCDDLEQRLRQAEDRASKLVEAVVQELVT